MKKLILSLLLIFFTATFLFAEDRVRVQVQYRKALWSCPSGDEITNLNVGTPSVYEHTCKDGTWLNSFKEYNGVLTYTPEEFEKADSQEKETAKTEAVDKWIYGIKNPPKYVEPKPEEIQAQIDSKQQEIESLTAEKQEAIRKINKKSMDEGTGFLYDPNTGKITGIVN